MTEMYPPLPPAEPEQPPTNTSPPPQAKPVVKGQRRTFTPEERAKYVAVIEERMAKGEDVKVIAPEIGINEALFYRWRKGVGRTRGKRKGRYSDDKKRELVARASELKALGMTIRQIGKELKCDPNTIRKFRHELKLGKLPVTPKRIAKGKAKGNIRPAPEPKVAGSLADRMGELETQLQALRAFVGM